MQTLPVGNQNLRDYATVFMSIGRFDDAACIITVLSNADDQSGIYGPPHPRAVAAIWAEIAENAASGNGVLLASFVKEAEKRFAAHAFAVPRLVESAADLAAARSALQVLIARNPHDTQARECLVRAFLAADLVEDAEREIEGCTVGGWEAETLEKLRGLVAMRKHDWEAARSHLVAYAKQRPNDPSAVGLLDRADMARNAWIEGTADVMPPMLVIPWVRDEPETRQLLLRFESIGVDCEFGGVQRRFGAEPLGLFRWAATDIPSLMNALAAGLDGIGDPANTKLTVNSSGHIFLHDPRWGFSMYTFLREREVDLETLHPKMCRRMSFLRTKFLDDLRAGEKTLVYSCNSVDRGQLVALHEALSSFGPVRLLNVRAAAASQDFPAEEPGSVTEIRPKLFVGRLSRETEGVPVEEWVDLCRTVEWLLAGGDANYNGLRQAAGAF